jgi:excisionase family DNA binding protein
MAQDTRGNRRTYDVPEFAEMMGIGRSAAYNAIARGEIEAIRIGRRLVIPRTVAERLLGNDMIRQPAE